MTGCQEVRDLLPRLIGLELAPETEREVREHLGRCQECRAALDGEEPVLGLALRLAEVRGPADEEFVASVLGGVRLHRGERRLHHRPRRWLAAAALVVAILGGTLFVRWRLAVQGSAEVAAVRAGRPVVTEGALVEVEGDGVRLYQLSPAGNTDVQVALVVDPRLEL